MPAVQPKNKTPASIKTSPIYHSLLQHLRPSNQPAHYKNYLRRYSGSFVQRQNACRFLTEKQTDELRAEGGWNMKQMNMFHNLTYLKQEQELGQLLGEWLEMGTRILQLDCVRIPPTVEVPFFQCSNKADEVCSWHWWSRLNRYSVIRCARNLEFHSSTLPSNSQRCQEYEPKASCSHAGYAIWSQESIILWPDSTSVYKILIRFSANKLGWFWVLFHEPKW